MSEKVLDRNKWREVEQVLVRGMSCAYHDPFQMSLGPTQHTLRPGLKDSFMSGKYGKQPRDKSYNSVLRSEVIKVKN